MARTASRSTRSRAKSTRSRPPGGVSPLILGNCSHLAHLGTADLVALSRTAECEMAFAGQTVFEQGNAAESAYLLLDGTVRLEHRDATGRRSGYDAIGPYATFGDVVLLGEDKRRYTATASQDSVIVRLPLKTLLQVLGRNSPQALAWRGAVMARLHRKEPEHADSFAWRLLDKLSQLFDVA